jgi:hypothetical protein
VAEVQLRYGVHHSSYLLRFAGEEEVTREQPHEFLQIVLLALLEDYLHVLGEEFGRDWMVSRENVNHGAIVEMRCLFDDPHMFADA